MLHRIRAKRELLIGIAIGAVVVLTLRYCSKQIAPGMWENTVNRAYTDFVDYCAGGDRELYHMILEEEQWFAEQFKHIFKETHDFQIRVGKPDIAAETRGKVSYFIFLRRLVVHLKLTAENENQKNIALRIEEFFNLRK